MADRSATAAGCRTLCLFAVLLFSLVHARAQYEFALNSQAQSTPGPPMRVGDSLTIYYDGYNVVQLSNMYDWHACRFARKTTNVSGVVTTWPKVLAKSGDPLTITPSVPGYLYLTSNKAPGDCSSGVRAVIYVSPAQNPVSSPRANASTVNFYFRLTYRTVSADCVQKRVPVVNGLYPGPTISVVSGDTVVVTVVNNLDEAISLHWHGMWHRGTQWQDGNAYGAQCPLPPNATYRYRFSTEGQSGTKWWHGHSNLLRASVYGALIITSLTEDPIPGPIVSRENVLMLGDWFYRQNQEIMDGLDSKNGNFTSLGSPDALTINGATCGNCTKYLETCDPASCLPCLRSRCPKLTMLTLEKGQTHRIRLINSALYGNINFRIQGHVFTVVEADGQLMKPVTYSSIDMLPGMTFSILVSLVRSNGTFWIVSNGRFDDAGINSGRAILRYDTSRTNFPIGPPPLPPTETADSDWSPNQQASFRSLYPSSDDLSSNYPDEGAVIRWAFGIADDSRYRYGVNGISYVHSIIPILYADQFNVPGIFDYQSFDPFPPPPPEGFADLTLGTTALNINYGSMVELILQNSIIPGLQHPWHLHGYDFWVVGRGEGDYSPFFVDESTYNTQDAPLRNTIIVHHNKWIAIRFRANNPGLWNLHCHLESHMHMGMQTFIRVNGGPGVPAPPTNYIRGCINNPVFYPPPTFRPPPPPPPPLGSSMTLTWQSPFFDQFIISAGNTVTFDWGSDAFHSVMPYFRDQYNDDDVQAYIRTRDFLQAFVDANPLLVAANGATGIDFFIGDPTNFDQTDNRVEAPWSLTFTFTTTGMYLFQCGVHLTGMRLDVLVI